MITYQRLPFIRVAEFHFDENSPAARADIVRHLWRSAPVSGARCEESHTLVLDLTSSPETLLAKMHNGTRWSIRRAEKDQFQYQFWCAGEPEAVAQFCGFYDAFATGSHLVPANRKRLNALTQLGVLDLSRVSDNAGRALVWHAHYRASHRVRMIHSASLLGKATDPALRGLIGRANCHNTWCDILRFQQQRGWLFTISAAGMAAQRTKRNSASTGLKRVSVGRWSKSSMPKLALRPRDGWL